MLHFNGQKGTLSKKFLLTNILIEMMRKRLLNVTLFEALQHGKWLCNINVCAQGSVPPKPVHQIEG